MSRLNSAVRGVIRNRSVQGAAMASGAAEEFAKGYVAGESIADAAEVAATLRRQGLLVSFAYLPQSDDESETPGMLSQALDGVGEAADGAEVSVKPSSLGLREDPSRAAAQLRDLCSMAEGHGASVTLEMQGLGEYEATLALWRGAVDDHPSLGLTLPADIRRAERDVAEVSAMGARVRLCVGSYPVSKADGFPKERDKVLAFVRCIRRAMEDGAYPMVATHDPTVIAITQDLARRNGVGHDGFEHQMFYGVRPLEQRRLTDIGYRSRTYIPFGPAWFEYLTTRIAARPRTLFSYLRAIADKR